MLVVLPISIKDATQMATLLTWMAKLGGCKGHQALIVTHTNIPFDQVIELRAQALQVFDAVELIGSEHPDTGWPGGANALFWTAAKHARNCEQPFLWVEADCVPLKAGWLDAIEGQYHNGELGAYMGHIYECNQPFLPARLMSGIAVYPHCAASGRLPMLPDSPRAWDVDGAEVMVTDGRHTPLIYHFWGQQNLPPTFVARKDTHSPVNAMTLEDIPGEVCLFHRCKNSSLINLLERKLFPHEFREKIAVCFPVYQGDIGLATLHANWMVRMGRRHEHRAIICHDPSCPVILLNQFELLLRKCFVEVETCVYARPPIPQYPAAANFAFQSVAIHMAKQKSPWFWFEADAIALKPDWIEQLQAEYDSCGKSWMGSIVPHLDHIQGTAIYPADAATRMPNAMRCGDGHAFDMAAREDSLHDRHDTSHLLFCVWTIMPDGTPSPVGGGNLPVNLTAEWARKHIPRSSVFIHRVKNDSLVRELLAGAQL